MVLMNDFKAMWRQGSESILRAVGEVGESGWLILGSRVAEFEKALAAETGFRSSIGVANGMDAIEISLRACGLKDGDKVLTTPLSAFATTLAILRAGGVPVFVDVDELGLIDLAQVEAALSADPSIRFCVPVHLFGFSLDLERLAAIKNKFNLTVIEDCAQSIGAAWGSQRSGSVGSLAATSFYPTKNLGCMGDGGAILSNSADLDQKCRTLRDYGQSEKYTHTEIGLNSRLDEVQAAIMSAQMLPALQRATARRNEIASFYLSNLKSPAVQLTRPSSKMSAVWHLFPVRVARDRDGFMNHLKARGIQSGIHYPILIPDQVAMKKCRQVVLNDMSVSRSWASQEVSLPIHPHLTQAELEQVVTAVNEWRS